MALGIPLAEIVQERARRDPELRVELLKGAIECMLGGEMDVATTLLTDCIESTGGFEALATLTGNTPEILKRMLTTEGSPNASDLFGIIVHLQRHEGIRLEVQAHPIEEPQRTAPDAATEMAGVADA